MSDGVPEPRFPYLAIDTPEERRGEIARLLFEQGATGVEERDGSTMAKGPGPGQVTLVGSFGELDDAMRGATALRDLGIACEVGEIVGDAWRDKYKEFFKPFELTDGIVITPPWIDHEGERVIVMDPGRAFGTGLHATTQLVAGVLALRKNEVADAQVLDVGTGTGVLGLVALVLGAASVVGVDNDPLAVDAAAENVELNGLESKMQVSNLPLANTSGAFDIVLANIRAEVLKAMAPDLKGKVKPGGLLVLSGILHDEHEEMIEMFTRGSWVLESSDSSDVQAPLARERDCWVALTLRAAP